MIKKISLIITLLLLLTVPVFGNTISNDKNHINSTSYTFDASESDERVTTSTLSSLPEAELGLTNILNILLIVIGILLILLGFAILIRLKH